MARTAAAPRAMAIMDRSTGVQTSRCGPHLRIAQDHTCSRMVSKGARGAGKVLKPRTTAHGGFIMTGPGPPTPARQGGCESAARLTRRSHELVGMGISRQGQPPASMPCDAASATDRLESASGVPISQVQWPSTRSSSATSPCPRTHSVIACDTFSIINGASISRTAILPHRPGIGLFLVFISHPLYRITAVKRNHKPPKSCPRAETRRCRENRGSVAVAMLVT